MSTKTDLQRYEEDEANVVLAASAEAAGRGYVEGPQDFYPDQPQNLHTSYARSSTPLLHLVLLYERVAVFCPPLPPDELEKRWNAPLSMLVDLARLNIVQPIIGAARDYGAEHFKPLLELQPPALWNRGVALLELLNMTETLHTSGCPLPVTEIAHLPALRAKYRSYSEVQSEEQLTARIEKEVLTNYADLCIFGEQAVADSLQYHRSAQEIADRLFLANEVRTYPVMFGMGGTANYDKAFLQQEEALARTLARRGDLSFVPQNVPQVMRGLQLDLSSLSARDIYDFHVSGRGQSLRRALRSFELSAGAETPGNAEEILEIASNFERQVLAATRELVSPPFQRSARRTERTAQTVLRLGIPAIGGWLGHMIGVSIWEGIGGVAILDQLLLGPARKALVDSAMILRFRPGLANLWRAASTEKFEDGNPK